MLTLNSQLSMQLTELSTFKNIHSGKPGFVCGSGTSLNQIPKNITEQGIVFCINAAGMYFEKYDYLYITDGATPHMAYWDEVVAKARTVILANPELEHVGEALKKDFKKEVYLLTRNYDSRNNYNFNSDILCMGNDAPISALHMAYYMGLRPITLCGIDMCYNKTTRYFTHTAYDHKDDSPYKESFDSDYKKGRISDGENLTDKWLQMSLPAWEKAYTQNPDARQHIVNASQISVVPGFKKVKI